MAVNFVVTLFYAFVGKEANSSLTAEVETRMVMRSSQTFLQKNYLK